MARLTRVRQKVFASNASNNGVFGSLQAGNPQTSNDVATLQSLSAFENGWDDAIEQGDKLPPLEEFQGIQYGISYQQAYMLQEGIAEWDANTPYYKGGLVKTISGTSFKLYCSLADNNTNKAVTNTSYWKKVMDSDDLYAYDSAVVHLAGNETITGAKTFMATQYIGNSSITKGTAPASATYYGLYFVDKNGTNWSTNQLGQIQMQCAANGDNVININAIQQTAGSTNNAGIKIAIKQNGDAYTSAPTPTDTTSTSSSQIATVGWVNSTGNNIVHLDSSETITGVKTFTNSINRKGSWTAGTAPSSNIASAYNFTDSTGTVYGSVNKYYSTSGVFQTRLSAKKTDGTGEISISIGYDENGNARALAPTPDTTTATGSTQIATTGWVNSVGNNVMHLTGNESVAGDKTFTGTIISTNKGSSVPTNVLAVKTARGSGNFSDLIGLYDTANNCRCATIRAFNTSAEHSLLLGVNSFNDGPPNGINIAYDSSNNLTTTAHTPSSATNNSTEIATTAWVKNSVDGGYISGIPDYANAVEFTTATYKPNKNGIIRALASGQNCMVSIGLGSFIIAKQECADGSSSENCVWAIVHSGDTYTLNYRGSSKKYFFIPFL